MEYLNFTNETQMHENRQSTSEKSISFINDETFEYLAANRRATEEALDWFNLPINTIYRIEELIPMQTKWGSHAILELRSRDGSNIKVWAPANVIKELNSGMKVNMACDVYIKSLGEKKANTSTGVKKRYFDFETVYV